jgi:uridine kinase
MRRSECIDRLATAIAAVAIDHPTRAAIDGVDGVGKTTLADELVAPLLRTGRQVVRASVDGFHRPRAARYERGMDSAEGYFLDSFDYAALRSALLDPLGPAGARRFRSAVFDHRRDEPVEVPPQTADADAILIFDGVFLQRPELASSWDIRIWVEAPFDVTVPRAVHRDTGGHDPDGALEAKYRRRYVPGQVIYLTECRPRKKADIIVDNADFLNPQLRFRRAFLLQQ